MQTGKRNAASYCEEPIMPRDEKQRKAYEFLLDHARSQQQFTAEDLARFTEWGKATADTYLKKQMRSIVEKAESLYRVKRHFIHLQEDDFVKRTSQKKNILPSYARTSFDSLFKIG